jgi:hypothetical protein
MDSAKCQAYFVKNGQVKEVDCSSGKEKHNKICRALVFV